MAKTKTKATKPKYPTKPTPKERAAQFEAPPVVMPEGLALSSTVEKSVVDVDGEQQSLAEPEPEEQSWATVANGASPERWVVLHDGRKHAGGPIKHSLCPGCLFLQGGQCSGPMSEDLRNNPETIGCVNARRIDGQAVS